MFIKISFPFKTDVAVCHAVVAKLSEPDRIFNAIPKIEQDYKQFSLLAEVYLFVVYKPYILLLFFIMKDDERVQRYGCITLRD